MFKGTNIPQSVSTLSRKRLGVKALPLHPTGMKRENLDHSRPTPVCRVAADLRFDSWAPCAEARERNQRGQEGERAAEPETGFGTVGIVTAEARRGLWCGRCGRLLLLACEQLRCEAKVSALRL
jgi:hypothetical protein